MTEKETKSRMITHKKKKCCVWHLTNEVRDEFWGQPPAFSRAGLQGSMHLEEGWQGRQCRPGPGVGVGVEGYSPTLSTLLINLPGGGSEKRGPFKHIGRAAASEGSRVLWSEWNFSKTKFLTSCFLPRLLKRCVVTRWAQKGSGHCSAGLFASQGQSQYHLLW